MVITLNIPDNGEPLVKKSQKISFSDPLFTTVDTSEVAIKVADPLGINPKDIFQHITVTIGEDIQKGATIAERKKLLGKKRIVCTHEGTVTHIDHADGSVVLSISDSDECTIASFVEGTVTNATDKHIEVDIGSAQQFELKSASESGGGYIFPMDTDAYMNASREDIENHIVVFDHVQEHIEAKIEALNANGFMFMKGTPTSTLPHATIKNAGDIKKLSTLEDKKIVFLKKEMKAFVY